MRIAVIGAGGTGGYFGGVLAKAGEEVTFLARGPHLEAIRASGLTVKSVLAPSFTVRTGATDDPKEVGLVDLVLFCVKTYDTDAAAPLVPPMLGRDTAVISVQNGIDSADRLARFIDRKALLGGLASFSSQIESPGIVSHLAGPPRLRFGEFSGERTRRCDRILESLRRAGVDADVPGDITVALWEKFLFICAVSGATALTRLPLGPIFAHPDTASLVRGIMEEVDAVARARGVPLPTDAVDRAMATAKGFDPSTRGSLYYDLAGGRRLEIESLNGTVVRIGREVGVPTPLNFAVYAALKPYAAGAPAAL